MNLAIEHRPLVLSLRRFAAYCLSLCLLVLTAARPTLAEISRTAPPISIEVVVVTMFENGKMSGDKPGEAQFWVERQRLDHMLPFPLGEYELRTNDTGLLLICTGGGIANEQQLQQLLLWPEV